MSFCRLRIICLHSRKILFAKLPVYQQYSSCGTCEWCFLYHYFSRFRGKSYNLFKHHCKIFRLFNPLRYSFRLYASRLSGSKLFLGTVNCGMAEGFAPFEKRRKNHLVYPSFPRVRAAKYQR